LLEYPTDSCKKKSAACKNIATDFKINEYLNF